MKYLNKTFYIILFVTLGPILFFKVYPPKAIKFKSMDFNLPLKQLTDPGRIDLVKSIDFKTKSHVIDPSKQVQAVTCPNFDPSIRRYSWTPYSKGDVLILSCSLFEDVVKVTINDQFHNLKKPIKIPFRKASEYFIKFYSSDSSHSTYVVVATPIDFAPLTGRVLDPSKVEDGYILSDFNPANLNSIFKQIWMSLYSFGLSSFSDMFAINKSKFFEKITIESTGRLDKRRKYNPYFFVLDKYGVPIYLKSNNLVSSNFQKTDFGYTVGVSRMESQPGSSYGKNLVLDSMFKVTEERRLSGAKSNFKSSPYFFYDEKSNNYVLKTHIQSLDENSGKNIYSFYFQEQNKKGEIIFEWNSLDFFESSLSSIPNGRFPIWNYFKGTSVSLSLDGNFVVSSAGLKTVIKVDRSSGEPIWMLGDAEHGNNDFTYINDTNSGPSVVYHSAQLSNGNILLFDNGDLVSDILIRPDGNYNLNLNSRVVEYEIDNVKMTAKKVLDISYGSSQASIGGSALRLPNGNTIVAWGSMGYITEHDSDGELVLELDLGGIIFKAVKVIPPHLMKNL